MRILFEGEPIRNANYFLRRFSGYGSFPLVHRIERVTVLWSTSNAFEI